MHSLLGMPRSVPVCVTAPVLISCYSLADDQAASLYLYRKSSKLKNLHLQNQYITGSYSFLSHTHSDNGSYRLRHQVLRGAASVHLCLRSWFFWGRSEVKGYAIDAESKTSRKRAVIKHVAQVRVALFAENFRTHHSK